MPDHASHDRGILLIISGPSGAGKTTITRAVEKEFAAVFSVSMTTRPQAEKDVEGVDYHFVSREAFDAARHENRLLEWAEVFGNFYGTPREPVEGALERGKVVLLEIDVQGAIQVKKNMPEAFAVFILPPSEEELLNRLRRRKREEEAVIQRRFAKARAEIQLARESGIYDAFVINDDLGVAIAETRELIEAELAARNDG
ncbi:MAG: guanylate kinase [Phycisphaeraceae bacterium]